MAFCQIRVISLCLLFSVVILLVISSSSRGERESKKVEDDLPKNFYDRLGVYPHASDKEIKQAYRKLAMEVS